MGIVSELRPELGLALGTSEVSLLELTAAYGVLANRGIRMPTAAVRRVTGPTGAVLEEPWRLGVPVLTPEVAYLVSSLLQGAVERGTAKRARVPGWSLAAKTGTSQDVMDLWMVGYAPRLAVGLWIGFDRPRPVGSHESAGRLAAPIWGDFMRRALRGESPDPVPVPEGLLPLIVNRHTGLLAEPEDPDAMQEFVIRGDAQSLVSEAPAEAMQPEHGTAPVEPSGLVPVPQPVMLDPSSVR
jgi:penicillin-binding protein 1A